MVFALSNLILLLPVACVLAIMLAMTGSMVVRPRNDGIRVFVQLIIWQFALLGLIGLMARSSLYSLAWVVVALGFLLQLWYWERGLARNILLLVLGTSCHSSQQLNKILHYLNHESRGYWRRLGRKFDRVWRATGSWELAFLHTRLARPARLRLALANLANQPSPGRFNQQLAQTNQEQKQASQWLGRLLIVSLSFLVLLVIGVFDELRIGPMLARIAEEFSGDKLVTVARPWKFILTWKLHIIVPVAVWLILISLYVIKKVPFVARHRPIAWFFRHYYRSLVLEGLADGLNACQDPALACQKLAGAMPVPSWSRRLRRASENLTTGQSLPDALVRSGLLKKNEAAPLQLCRDAESTAWALHELGHRSLERTLNRTHVQVQLLTFGLPLLSAVFITIYALSMFGTLTTLIEGQL